MALHPKTKSILKFAFKIALSATALYFVFRKIDVDEFITALSSVNLLFFILAILAFNASKLVASFRLKDYYASQDLHLDTLYNIKLYYVGMFYNLFLPGSVGGDAYKVYLLRQNSEVKTKALITATLLDRLSGLVLLFFEATVLFQFSSFDHPDYGYLKWLFLLAGILAIPAWYFIKKWLFNPGFLTVFATTTHYSFWVQVGQVLTAWLLLMAVGVEGHISDYLSLFMVSSVVAVLPFTIGGVGARELVFLYGYQFLDVIRAQAVAFTILFFFVTAITAIIGFFVSLTIDKKPVHA